MPPQTRLRLGFSAIESCRWPWHSPRAEPPSVPGCTADQACEDQCGHGIDVEQLPGGRISRRGHPRVPRGATPGLALIHRREGRGVQPRGRVLDAAISRQRETRRPAKPPMGIAVGSSLTQRRYPIAARAPTAPVTQSQAFVRGRAVTASPRPATAATARASAAARMVARAKSLPGF
jgi:hypothetical protein